jgi:hypothetical protein
LVMNRRCAQDPGQWGSMSANAFHEKAGRSQVSSLFKTVFLQPS